MIALVDYGLGNIQAFVNIFKRLNIKAGVARGVDELAGATKIVLPGVGAFDWAMTRLNDSGMRACLDHLVTVQKRPILGVCVGMQMMGRCSEEGQSAGLGWIDAEVKKFDAATFIDRSPLPHMGWNDVAPRTTDCLFKDMAAAPRFYFLHSYYFLPGDPDETLAVTDYNGPFAAAVRRDNVFGVQFHPEKSHQWGVQLLKNFAELAE